MRKTKIICTLGPSTEGEEVIEKMILSGMNTARMNFSHGTHDDHKRRIDIVKKVRERLSLPIGIMLDTKGPEIRIGHFENGCIDLINNQIFILTTDDVIGNELKASVSYKEITKYVKQNDTILINDGLIELKAEKITDTSIECRVIHGGKLSNRKSINLPDSEHKMDYLSGTDKEDILFGLENDIDFIAASFVRCKEDVEKVRKILNDNNKPNIKIISKIENRQGVENIDEIISVSDGIMIARGDMGVEIPFEKLPEIQKMIIKKCHIAGKISVTATQMLESMISNPRPTRAEVSDVANAIYDGTSAIMLSGETAVGKFPIQAIRTMDIVAKSTEESINYKKRFLTVDVKNLTTTDAICHSACTCAIDLEAKCIIAVTKSGHSARMVSKFKPPYPIIAPTSDKDIYHKLSLVWGVIPIVTELKSTTADLFKCAIKKTKEAKLINTDDLIVITGSSSVNKSKTTNLLYAYKVK